MLGDKQRDEHAKMAAQVMQQMWRDDKTKEEKLDLFRAMEERYPNVGWGKEGRLLKKMWDRQASLKEPCPW